MTPHQFPALPPYISPSPCAWNDGGITTPASAALFDPSELALRCGQWARARKEWVAVRDDDLQAAENSKTFADAQAHLKLKRAESKGNSSGHVRAPRFRKRHATELAPSNVSTSASASDVTVADKTFRDIPWAETLLPRNTQKRSGSTSSVRFPRGKGRENLHFNLQKVSWDHRLAIPLVPPDLSRGWGIEKDGISMSAVEYAQNVWNSEYWAHVRSTPTNSGIVYLGCKGLRTVADHGAGICCSIINGCRMGACCHHFDLPEQAERLNQILDSFLYSSAAKEFCKIT
ncbi:hypothetical protein B0H13DRAFT_1900989 [Mycena leptocephala]|nr:hypothetical protein B0H13DRAFT_1900989 [Mycena leptocephala]